MSSSVSLPSAFVKLEPFAETWALASEAERNQVRRTSPMADLETFYDAILPEMRPIIAHLNEFVLDDMPMAEQRLLQMAQSFMEVAIAIEMFKEPDETGAFPAEHYAIEEAGA